MLQYLGDGPRRYGRNPIPINRRAFWEFQAVLHGEIALLLPDNVQPRRRRLWIFPPNHPHGWTGTRSTTAEIVVFHFSHVPEPLRQSMAPLGFLEMPLNPPLCARLRHLARQARHYEKYPSAGMPLCHEQILLEISLMALESKRLPQAGFDSRSPRPVERSLQWFSSHMEQSPGLDEVAQIIGISPAHLRRLFHRTVQASPKSLFDQLRFQRAMQLMADPALKLDSVAQQCGFSSVSAFSRAFRHRFGCAPTVWRGCL